MASHFKQGFVDDHEYEAKASPMATEAISKLHTGEGVRKLSARPRKGEGAAAPAKGILVGVALAALLVIVVGFLLVRAILGQAQGFVEMTSDLYPTEAQEAGVSKDEDSGSVEFGSIEYVDETFSMVPVEGGIGVVATDAGGSQRTLFVLDGTPTTMFLYNGTLIVPQNLDDGWNVISYVVDGDALASQVVVDGNPVEGDGEITGASLDEAQLTVTDTTGATTRVSL